MSSESARTKEQIVSEFKSMHRAWSRWREKGPPDGRLEGALQTMIAAYQEQAQLLDLARDTILVRDLEDRIVFWNRGAETTYGWGKEEALGQHSHTFLRTVFPQPLTDIRAVLLGKGEWQGDLVHTTRQGKRILVDSRWTLRRDAQGLPQAHMEINSDITLRRWRETQLREQRAQLRNLAAELTRVEERERRRIALQLHDGVGQCQAMCRLILSKLMTTQPGTALALQEAIALLDRSTADTRALCLDLSPPVLYEMGLLQALQDQAESLRQSLGLVVELDLPGREPPLDEDGKVFLFRAASEMMLNVAKHAGCQEVVLSLGIKPGRVVLVAADRGRGFDKSLIGTPKSLGLFSLRERLRGLGGALRIESRPGQGTKVSLHLPLREPDRQESEEAHGYQDIVGG
ncbi:MAG: ATP-binding protein [Pseudomonadota bacterium]